jgi:predicted aspartyl protease
VTSSPYRIAAVLAALALVPLSAAADTDAAAPPLGIQPVSNITLRQIAARHKIAIGKLDPAPASTRVEQWTFTEGNRIGTQTLYRSGDDYREDRTLGPFHYAHGELAGKAWEQNENGLTRSLSGLHQRDEVNDYALDHPLLAASNARLLGEVTSPKDAYVVELSPKNGYVEYAYFDASTYLLVRDERAESGRRLVSTYDDFRVDHGARFSWHIHESNGLPNDDRDWQLKKVSFGQPVDPLMLAVPASRDPVSFTTSTVTLPARVEADRIILTAQIGKHKVNFLMDSGSSGILLNRDVADATGVQSFGAITEVTAGEYTASDALIPKIDFGVAQMTNAAGETAPYAEWTSQDTPIAGLMGYDFIAGAVLHVDYVDGTVQAIAFATFTPPANAIALPIRLDDGVPVITATIGQATGKNFLVDTGADRSMIFSAFAREHSSAVADQGLGDETADALPFVRHIYGVGGKVQVRPVQVSVLQIGRIRLPNWHFDVSQDAPAFEGDDYDGIIGQDVLRNFDVYFDYSRAMMYLVPNERYRQRWGS